MILSRVDQVSDDVGHLVNQHPLPEEHLTLNSTQLENEL